MSLRALAVLASLLLGAVAHGQDVRAVEGGSADMASEEGTAETASAGPEGAHGTAQWDAMTMFHGIPSRNVRAIAQDREGLLWFGTDAGLVRYDGQRIERAPLGGGATAVRALAVDGDGRLWVGTEHGAFLRDASGAREVPQTRGHPIAAILVGADGRVRLASRRGRVFTCRADLRVDAVGPESARLLRRADGSLLELVALASQGGRLVAGTRGRGLLVIAGQSVSEMKHPLRPFFVNAIAGRGEGLVFGAETNAGGRGLFALDRDGMRVLDVRTGPVTALALAGPSAGLWAGTRDRGLVHLRADGGHAVFTLESTRGGLHSNAIHALLVDRDGVVWVGTDRGVCRYDPNAPRTLRLGATPDGNFVQALFESPDGRVWAGTQRGLFVRVREDGPWQIEPALARRAVHALGAGPDGRLLAGCAGGLQQQDGGGWRAVPRIATDKEETDSVRAIEAYRGITHLVTYGRGLERLDSSGRTLLWPNDGAVHDPTLREVVSLAAVGDRLWIGTAQAGTFVFDGARVTRSGALSALGTLRSAAGDGRGGVWIATSRGLFRWVDGRTEPIVENEDVRALLAAGGGLSVWCATRQSGLLNVAVVPTLGVVRARVDTEYGLPSDNVFAMLATANRLLLGTNRGLVEYDPGHGAPSVRIVRVLGRRPYTPEEWTSALRLDYPQNGLLVEAAAVGSRTYPERFQYAFRLEKGSGRAVAERLSRDGQFAASSLAPGRYRLSARGLGTNLIASAPVVLDFEVGGAPIPWASIALAALLACALLALTWGGVQYSRLRDANAALSETRLQLVEETEKERRRIARDLHDQTLADLRGLMIALDASGASAVRQDVETISGEVRRICEDLSPSVLENVGLTAALEWALDETIRRSPADAQIRGSFVCPEGLGDRLSFEPAVEIQVYRIVQEALANAARHSAAREIRLVIELSAVGALQVTVEDDGRGFDPATVPHGRGLANIRSRASLLGASVEWHRPPVGGTRLTLAFSR